jgi:hypothetical protein
LPVDAVNCVLIRLIKLLIPPNDDGALARPGHRNVRAKTTHVVARRDGPPSRHRCGARASHPERRLRRPRTQKPPETLASRGSRTLRRPARAGPVRTWPTSFRRLRQHSDARVERGVRAAVQCVDEVSIHVESRGPEKGGRLTGRALYARISSRQ